LGYTPPYYLRLRIYARQIDYFYRKLRALPPVYENCPVRCLAPEADRANDCPDCDYQVFKKALRENYYRSLSKEIARELIERGVDPGDARKYAEDNVDTDWSFELIREDYGSLCEIEALAGTETEDRPGAYDPAWSVRIKTGIGVIREERYKVRREVRYNKEQDDKARARAEAKRNG
jgi:hypothetical protein